MLAEKQAHDKKHAYTHCLLSQIDLKHSCFDGKRLGGSASSRIYTKHSKYEGHRCVLSIAGQSVYPRREYTLRTSLHGFLSLY